MLNNWSSATLHSASQLAYTNSDLASLTRLRCPCEWWAYILKDAAERIRGSHREPAPPSQTPRRLVVTASWYGLPTFESGFLRALVAPPDN